MVSSKICCSECFTYDSVQEHIKDNGFGRGYCDFCEKKSQYCINADELYDLFSPLVNLYTPIVNFLPVEIMKEYDGETLVEKLRGEWELFTNDSWNNVENILSAIFGKYNPMEEDGIDLESWVENQDMFWAGDDNPSNVLEVAWGEFVNEIMNENRFFPQRSIDLTVLNEIPILFDTIKANNYLFRARKSYKQNRIAPKNMGKPPSNLSSPGRANPRGIPYLYLASDIQTAINEVRPNTMEFITVGKFKILENLQILDLSNPRIHDPFLCRDYLGYTIELLSFFRMLGHELSKPIDPKEKDLHYIPTQYLCEFIKHQGYDGISYKSHLARGKNIALFSDKKVKCTRSTLFEINAEPKEVLNRSMVGKNYF